MIVTGELAGHAFRGRVAAVHPGETGRDPTVLLLQPQRGGCPVGCVDVEWRDPDDPDDKATLRGRILVNTDFSRTNLQIDGGSGVSLAPEIASGVRALVGPKGKRVTTSVRTYVARPGGIIADVDNLGALLGSGELAVS